MDLKQFAEMLNGKEYGYPQFTQEEIQIAKDNGFVIVYGASDYLMEFEGTIYDERGCFDGGKVYVCETGCVEYGNAEDMRSGLCTLVQSACMRLFQRNGGFPAAAHKASHKEIQRC